MFYVEARKNSDWSSVIESSRDFDDREFLIALIQLRFIETLTRRGFVATYGSYSKENPRKQVLQRLMSSPERLSRIADRNQVEVGLFSNEMAVEITI